MSDPKEGDYSCECVLKSYSYLALENSPISLRTYKLHQPIAYTTT